MKWVFISNFMIINKMNGISEKLRSLNEALPSITADELNKRTDEIISEWKNSEWIIHAFINADSVSETEKNLRMLGELAKNGLTDEFAVYCTDTLTQVESIRNSEKISKENIF